MPFRPRRRTRRPRRAYATGTSTFKQQRKRLRRGMLTNMPSTIYSFKRISCGRLLQKTNASASAGATATLNDANNVLSCVTPAAIGSSFYSFGMAFCLKDVPNYTDFTTLFDLYKIPCVVWRLVPLNTTSFGGNNINANTISGWIHMINDEDDYAGVTASDVGIDEIRQYASYKVKNICTQYPFKRKIRPKVSVSGSDGTAFNQAINVRPTWINCAYNEAVHYGMKWVIEIINYTVYAQTVSFKLEPVYYLQFKDIR